MHTTSELAIRVLLAACLLSLFAGIVSAATDLDHDGIPDDVDNETVVVTSASLPAGTYAFQELVVTNNAVLTLESDTSLPGFKGVAISAGNLSIDPGSALSADDRGYPAQAGPGYVFDPYLGAGHGGRGGGIGTQFGGPIYDSALHPTEPGSGSYEHPGGGVITLAVTNTLVVDGRITASGAGGGSGNAGGSGGSIAITAGRVEGAGTIAADGGAEPWWYGGGGGGRVAVSTGVPAFTGTLQAKGGSAANGYTAGEDGTVVTIDTTANALYAGHSFRFQANDEPIPAFSAVALNGSQVVVESGLSLASTDVRIDHISKLTLAGNGTLQLGTLRLADGSTLSTSPGVRIDITASTLSVDATSTISADDRGYPAQTGPGYPNDPYLGAGHGGRGGGIGNTLGGPIYDSALHPTEPGSGSYDHAGGGVITLAVTNTLVVDGRITASGAGSSGGGGSGGSIAITAGRFEGAGTIAADGGAEPWWYGGGGGGRVAVSTGVPAFTGTLQAKGGSAANGYNAGEDGTVVTIDTTANALYAGHSFRFQANDEPIPAFSAVALNGSQVVVESGLSLASTDVRIDHISKLTLAGNGTLQLGTLRLADGSTLSTSPGVRIDIAARNLSIDSGSVLSADDRGYPAQTGPGYPTNPYSGAGHGGRGGGSGDQLGGPIYDSALHPTEPGSGSYDHPGGGVITLAVTNTLVVDGRITASGAGGSSGGGGSGGSIAITTGRFEGAGTIAADGGPEPWWYGGGGGGRVAVSTGVPAFTGTLQAKGGPGSNGYTAGEDGTVVVTTIPAPPVTVPGGASTPTDMNGDGKYDDINGNSRKDFADVVLYFNQMSWIATHEPILAFDFNGNGRIDFADVVWLFNHL